MNRTLVFLPLFATAALAAPSSAQASDPAVEPASGIDRMVVVARREDVPVQAGAVSFLDPEVLARHAYADINRTLRQVPGLNIVEEEGFGIRPSIGIRGAGTDRNTKIAVLEDGVPVAPAPYAAPAAYYFPRTSRMHAIEVSKGPAAIKYGPQTVAGAVGLYSAPIPGMPGEGLSGRASLSAGDHGIQRGHALIGGFFGSDAPLVTGWSVETLQEHADGFKDLDSGGDTGFRLQDYVAKLAFRSAPGASRPQSLELKLQQSDERSDETYLGLALEDFRRDAYRRYRASQLDRIDVDHRTLQATYRIDLTDRLDVSAIAYQTQTERAWYKLNDVRNAADTGFTSLSRVLADPASFPVEYAALVGLPGTSSAPGALRVRNNAREYEANGLQVVLGYAFSTGDVTHDLEFSARHHRDEEDRFQNDDRYQMVDGIMQLSASGLPGTQDNRLGEAEAWAFYVRDSIESGRWTLTPGVRYETIDLERTNWGTADPARSGPGTVVRSSVDTLLPGLGVLYALGDGLALVGGVHRGFVNPAPGSQANEEKSWNYEAGVRWSRAGAAIEAMGFYVDYENLVGTCTASTGGDCNIGDQFDGGTARVHGLELSAAWDVATRLGWSIGLPITLSYTWTEGEFRSSFTSSFQEWGTVEAGDEIPLVPAHQLTLSAGLEGRRWSAWLTLNYVDEARSVAGSGPIPETERLDRRTLFDVSGEYALRDGVRLFAAVENLTDETYNAGFRPAGARPGAPRTALAGVRLRF